MKILKFRMWNGVNMEIVDTLELYESGEHLINDSHKLRGEVDIMQFTGLKDKNGVDIYEGDIIKHLIYDFYDKKQIDKPTYNKNESVTFINGYFGLNDEIASFGCMNHTYEVIGNIYENPELIK